MGIVQDMTRGIEISSVETDGRYTIGDQVAFVLDSDFACEGTVREIRTADMRPGNPVTRLTIESAHGLTFIRHACDVQHVTGWQDRVDPAVAEAVGAGHGPLPIRLHPDTPAGPAVSVHWLYDRVLVVGIYHTERTGTVYRWDNGLEEAPTVGYWDLDGPECQ